MAGLDPLGPVADQLASVVALRELADQREDAAVENALRAGWTWTNIATALGITRQAVHKKHLKRVVLANIDLRRRSG
jgi:hypothetical protein